jgi:hypothetical protein
MNGWRGFDSFGVLLTPGRSNLCQASCDKSSTILSIKRRNSIRSDSSLFVFAIRKTLNQDSLLFAHPRAIAWRLHCMVQLRLLSPTTRAPDVLSGDA